MSNRRRLTRQAAPAPAIPTDPDHPAMQDDPDMDEYTNGDPSAWAEDPHMGPYEKGGHPAIPDEGPGHPAYKSAADIRVAAEQKAAKCIRIAQALLGDAPENVIENQAFPFMHLADADLDFTLDRMAQYQAPAQHREASAGVHRLARIEHQLRRLQAMMDSHYGCGEVAEEEEEEAMLAEMLREEEAPVAMDEEAMLAEMLTDELDEDLDLGDDLEDYDPEAEEMLRTMLAEDASEKDEESEEEVEASKKAEDHSEDEEEVEASKKAEDHSEDEESEEEVEASKSASFDDDMGIELGASFDDMDMEPTLTENDTVLASLFTASDEEGEEEEVEIEEVEASKKASAPRPQPRKASRGARTVGAVTGMSRAASDDLADLQKLWASAPDVSDYFKG